MQLLQITKMQPVKLTVQLNDKAVNEITGQWVAQTMEGRMKGIL